MYVFIWIAKKKWNYWNRWIKFVYLQVITHYFHLLPLLLQSLISTGVWSHTRENFLPSYSTKDLLENEKILQGLHDST